MTDISSADELTRRFQTQLDHEWQRFRDIDANDTSRGSSYETELSNILESYLGSSYEIVTNCSIMDRDLECFDTFETSGQNEFDVVSLFCQAIPRIVVEEGKIRWVPLPSIAFVCEVKSRVDKGRLSSDLDKLSTLRSLEGDPADRFPTKMQGPSTVDRQIHCLVYDQASIANDTFTELLAQSQNSWDMVLIVEENVLVVNETLPFQSELSVLFQRRARG